MTQEQHAATVEAEDEYQDSPVIKALRKQIRDLTKERDARPDRDTLEAELRPSWERDKAIEAELMGFGHPKAILDIVKDQLGESEVNRESVAKALEVIGYTVELTASADEAPVSDAGSVPDEMSNLAQVTSLSRQVQSAASGATSDDLSKRIAGAKSREELVAIMDEAGAVTDQV